MEGGLLGPIKSKLHLSNGLITVMCCNGMAPNYEGLPILWQISQDLENVKDSLNMDDQ